MKFHLVEVVGVRVEMPSNQPIVLLKEIDGIRYLPIWVGAAEATAIAFSQQGVLPPRPLTHDLFKSVIEELGSKIMKVELTDLVNGVFYADLILQGEKRISARPSDAIALAVRSGCEIAASEKLFEAAGIEIPDQADDEVEAFREFLEDINPEDFLA
jgi:uncharacterized protein